MKQTLQNLIVTHGFRKVEAVTVNYIAQMIERNFKYLSRDELMQAFELAACGKIEVKHHNELTARFVGEVIKQYYRFKRMEKLESERRKNSEAPTNILISDGRKGSFDKLLEFYEKNGEFPVAWDWWNAYHHMIDEGMVTESPEEIERIKSLAESVWQKGVRQSAKDVAAVLRQGSGKQLSFYREYCKFKLRKLANITP